MDISRKKKIAASIAAILHFESEGTVVAAAQPAVSAPPLRVPAWSAAGRQEQMSMRVFLQKRMIKSW